MKFIRYTNQLSRSHHGYIKGRYVETAILQFTETILNSFEKNVYICLDHNILLQKLEKYGICVNVLE